MKTSLKRAAVLGATVIGLFGLSGGIAGAAETPVWVLPGVDGEALIGPISQLPTQALAPVYDVLTLLAGRAGPPNHRGAHCHEENPAARHRRRRDDRRRVVRGGVPGAGRRARDRRRAGHVQLPRQVHVRAVGRAGDRTDPVTECRAGKDHPRRLIPDQQRPGPWLAGPLAMFGPAIRQPYRRRSPWRRRSRHVPGSVRRARRAPRGSSVRAALRPEPHGYSVRAARAFRKETATVRAGAASRVRHHVGALTTSSDAPRGRPIGPARSAAFSMQLKKGPAA